MLSARRHSKDTFEPSYLVYEQMFLFGWGSSKNTRTAAGERALSSLLLFQPLQPNAVIINPFDCAVQLPLDPVEAVGMLIENATVITELRLDGIKSTSDAQKPLPYLLLEGLEPVRHHRSELIDSHSFTRHGNPHSSTGMPTVNSCCQVRCEDRQFEAVPNFRNDAC